MFAVVSQLRRACLLALAGLALTHAMALPAVAREDRAAEVAARLIAAGSWHFAARVRNAEGLPECTETWTFRADGTASLTSAEQQLQERWRVEEDEGQLLWLHKTFVSSNDGPDCLGNRTDPARVAGEESSLVLLFFNNGTALTCWAPDLVQDPDGRAVQLWRDETCWGSITPLGQMSQGQPEPFVFTYPGEEPKN